MLESYLNKYKKSYTEQDLNAAISFLWNEEPKKCSESQVKFFIHRIKAIREAPKAKNLFENQIQTKIEKLVEEGLKRKLEQDKENLTLTENQVRSLVHLATGHLRKDYDSDLVKYSHNELLEKAEEENKAMKGRR